MSEDRLTDLIDRANHIAAQTTAERIDHYSRLAQPEQVQNEDGTWPETECRDCGDDIVPERLAMGRVRCVRCQQVVEFHQNQNQRR